MTGDWARALKLLMDAPDRIEKSIDRALMQEAHFMRSKIVSGMREQAPGGKAFLPLAGTTLATRKAAGFRGTKALIKRGDLRNSIVVHRDGKTVFVGVLRTARNATGRAEVDVARTNEEGREIVQRQRTVRQRRFLMMAFREAGLAGASFRPGVFNNRTNIVIRIPARPFFAPVFEKYGEPSQVLQRFIARVAFNLGGDFGGFGTAPPVR